MSPAFDTLNRAPRLLAATAAMAVAALSLAGCGGGSAGDSGGAVSPAAVAHDPDVRASAAALARRVSAPWPGQQRTNGRYMDDVRYPTRYGESVLGYSLIDAGLRQHDDRPVSSGLHALAFAIQVRPRRRTISVFENLTMGAVYELGRRRLAGDARWRRLLPGLQDFLRHSGVRRLQSVHSYGNHQLVEAVEVEFLLRSALRSNRAVDILGPRRAYFSGLARGLILDRIPAMVGRNSLDVDGQQTALFSDPPDQPSAYQGLSLGLYARAMHLLGDPPAARSVLRRAAEASWRLMAPDGDAGYIGRNQEEAWILSATAYGAHEAASLPDTPRWERARFEGLARGALTRLARTYVGGPDGVWILPSIRKDLHRGSLAVDPSGGAAPFGGLTLMFLNWLADSPGRPGVAPGPLSSDSNGVTVLGSDQSQFAVERHGDLWFAVRAMPSAHKATDIRYDPGLVALKRRRPDGTWADLIPQRPRVLRTTPDSAGPLLLGPRMAVPAAARIRASRDGTIDLLGNYRLPLSKKPVRQGVSWSFRPVGCGVEASFAARAGDRMEYSVFLRDGPGAPAIAPGRVSSGGAKLTFSPRVTPRLEHGYVSGTDPRMVRVRLLFSPPRAERIRVTVCGPA